MVLRFMLAAAVGPVYSSGIACCASAPGNVASSRGITMLLTAVMVAALHLAALAAVNRTEDSAVVDCGGCCRLLRAPKPGVCLSATVVIMTRC
jgi:hypothetical protein